MAEHRKRYWTGFSDNKITVIQTEYHTIELFTNEKHARRYFRDVRPVEVKEIRPTREQRRAGMAETTEEFVENQREQCKANKGLSQYGKSKSADYLTKKLLEACDRLEQADKKIEQLEEDLARMTGNYQTHAKLHEECRGKIEQQQESIRELLPYAKRIYDLKPLVQKLVVDRPEKAKETEAGALELKVAIAKAKELLK